MQQELVVLGAVALAGWVQIHLSALAGLESRSIVVPPAARPDDFTHVCQCKVECAPTRPVLDLSAALAVGLGLCFVCFAIGYVCGARRSRVVFEHPATLELAPTAQRPRGKGVISLVP